MPVAEDAEIDCEKDGVDAERANGKVCACDKDEDGEDGRFLQMGVNTLRRALRSHRPGKTGMARVTPTTRGTRGLAETWHRDGFETVLPVEMTRP